jgi:Ser/Thr protein kinase RdoA (MazF antagonist)
VDPAGSPPAAGDESPGRPSVPARPGRYAVGVSELVGAVLTRPAVDAPAAAQALQAHWGIAGVLRPLPSERDRNFAVEIEGLDRFVLKIANAAEDPVFLDLQHRALERLAAAGVPCQGIVRSLTGSEVVDIGGPDRPALARLLTWLPGRPLASIPPADRPRGLLHDLGEVMGRTALALGGFDHAAAHRRFQWSAEEGLAVVAAHAPAVVEPSRRALLAHWQTRLGDLAGRFPRFRHGVIHNDANDHNVLVSADGARVTGLLDLGDSIWSITVNELAVAAAYAVLGSADPLEVIGLVSAGFETVVPLEPIERDHLIELVALRLATSVALSAHQSQLDPDDLYLTVSEAPAWDILERLAVADQPR